MNYRKKKQEKEKVEGKIVDVEEVKETIVDVEKEVKEKVYEEKVKERFIGENSLKARYRETYEDEVRDLFKDYSFEDYLDAVWPYKTSELKKEDQKEEIKDDK